MLSSRNSDPGWSDAPLVSGLLEAPLSARDLGVTTALLPEFRIARRVPLGDGEGRSGIVAWRHSRYRRKLSGRAATLGVPFLLLGPGLLRAPQNWGVDSPKLSATAHMMTGPSSPADFLDPSRLLAMRNWENPVLLQRAANVRRDLVAKRLGGPWWTSGTNSEMPRGDKLALVVVDEDNGWAEIAAPSPALLGAMLSAALAENAPERIVVLTSDRNARRGSVPRFLRDAIARGGAVLTRPVDIWEAIGRAERVYTAGGETGFLALLAGVKVRCFADSFYSGWGVTTDEAQVQQKPFLRPLDEIFAGACLVATRYLDPYHMTNACIEDVLGMAAEWRAIEAANRRIAVCLGMSFWKRRQVADFLRSSAGIPAFRRSSRSAIATARARSGGAIAAWASRIPAGLAEAARSQGIALIRVEDGFVRSVGLGSDFMPPASVVLDRGGMHFDPSVRSDLERLLLETDFDAALVERARRLILQLVSRGVTKYNLGKAAPSIGWPVGKRRILVPGQVEDDLSVRLGGEGVRGNLDLLARVRAANPDAYILYKPHPDVEAGHRKGRVPDAVVCNFADDVIRDVSTAAVLEQIDELHTLTSLAGFEALLRQRGVVVYGRPFYAGWGLTTDVSRIERGRQLTLEELVAGALIIYPRYLDPVTRLPCGPELVIERLEVAELWRPTFVVVARRLQGILSRRLRGLGARRAKLPANAFPPTRRDEYGAPRL